MTLTPWKFLMVPLAGWMNRQQQEAISYLKEENRILREKLGHRPIILNDSQKRRLARAAARLGKDALRELTEPTEPQPRDGPVLCRERLGGLLKSYYREAA